MKTFKSGENTREQMSELNQSQIMFSEPEELPNTDNMTEKELEDYHKSLKKKEERKALKEKLLKEAEEKKAA